MKRICVYTGSNKGIRQEYQEAAQALGHELVERGLGLVYGGAGVGLMAIVANTVLDEGGEVIGVMPRGLFRREVAHPKLFDLREVGSMHERKALMAELSDGFIALPGGFGTFDELFEIVTWAQIGLHHKPVGLLNVLHFFDPLLAMVVHSSAEGFISPTHASLLLHKDTAAALLDSFDAYVPPAQTNKWSELPPAP